MALSRIERILILAKTYPSPSAQHVETSCVAGITEHGCMRRLYPVPFRLIKESQKFKKWQWVKLRVEKATRDHRPESHKVYVDDIVCGEQIDTRRDWAERRLWLEKIPTFDSPEAMDAARLSEGISFALLRPRQVLGLDIISARHADWTAEEREKLTRELTQGDLFSEAEVQREMHQLRKIPFDFYYRCIYSTSEGEREYKQKIIDWEAGALFWRCRMSHGDNWEQPFRAKLEGDLIGKDLMFLMGNLHRFQDQWVIVSLIYPPKLPPQASGQASLF